MKRTTLVAAALLTLGLFLLSGCAKEALVEPGSLPAVVTKADDQGGVAVDDEGSINGKIAPISDDGDDQGDRERSNRPKDR